MDLESLPHPLGIRLTFFATSPRRPAKTVIITTTRKTVKFTKNTPIGRHCVSQQRYFFVKFCPRRTTVTGSTRITGGIPLTPLIIKSYPGINNGFLRVRPNQLPGTIKSTSKRAFTLYNTFRRRVGNSQLLALKPHLFQ